MNSPIKKINKWLVGVIIGGTFLGLTSVVGKEKTKGFLQRMVASFIGLGRRVLHQAERLGTTLGKGESTK